MLIARSGYINMRSLACNYLCASEPDGRSQAKCGVKDFAAERAKKRPVKRSEWPAAAAARPGKTPLSYQWTHSFFSANFRLQRLDDLKTTAMYKYGCMFRLLPSYMYSHFGNQLTSHCEVSSASITGTLRTETCSAKVTKSLFFNPDDEKSLFLR